MVVTIQLDDTSKANLSTCGCSQCAVACLSCGVTSNLWTTTLAGIINDDCSNCAGWNRGYIMAFTPVEPTFPCIWEEDVSLGCGIVLAQLAFLGGTMTFALRDAGGFALASWSKTGDIDCYGPNILTFSGDTDQCDGYPATITVEPA